MTIQFGPAKQLVGVDVHVYSNDGKVREVKQFTMENAHLLQKYRDENRHSKVVTIPIWQGCTAA